MIYCVWYPSGGFGHFVNTIISLYGENFTRPKSGLILSTNGDCHMVPLVFPKYKRGRPFVMPDHDADRHYTVLIDNGINDETQDFVSQFPGSKIVKICYDDKSWPIVAHTHIAKAMLSDLDENLAVNKGGWTEVSDWSSREKYFLYLRDHELRYHWRQSEDIDTLPISCLYHYEAMRDRLQQIGINLQGGENDWSQWFTANQKYIGPVITAQKIIDNLHGPDISLAHIRDLWTQAVIYYYLFLEFGFEVPHNDYADFFKSTGEINRWLAQ